MIAPLTQAFVQALADFIKAAGIIFIGKAQEKVSVFRTEKRRNPVTGQSYPRIVRAARLCLNGHEYAKRQLTQGGIAYAALDNGFLTCADPAQLQAICDELSPARIDALLHKWLAPRGRGPCAALAPGSGC